jgi:tyrosyl-tRNA synthetase
MSIPDALIVRYMELATAIARDEIAATASGLTSEATNPRDAKVRLAKALVTQYHSAEAAEEAARFRPDLQRPAVPRGRGLVHVDPDALESGGQVGIIRLITMCGKGAISSSEAGRLVAQGGVKLDGEAISDRECRVSLDRERRLQVGKRRFYLVSMA